MTRLGRDPDLRRKMGAAARKHIETNFEVNARTAALEDVVIETLSR